jgi:hypothetical protein
MIHGTARIRAIRTGNVAARCAVPPIPNGPGHSVADLTTLKRQRCTACDVTSFEPTCFLCGAPMTADPALTVADIEPVESNRQRQARRFAEP